MSKWWKGRGGRTKAHDSAPRFQARYLRDSPSRVLATRQPGLTESRDDIRHAWRRTAALAMDLLQNSGRLKGAADQVIADTVGVELQLTPKPDLSRLGYSSEEADEWCKLVKREWKLFAWDAAECDARGKFTLPQLVDVALRYNMAFGEVTGLIDYFPAEMRARYGISTGVKLCLIPPTRLVQDTDEAAGLYQGIFHDENGRPTSYIFESKARGYTERQVYPAFDGDGRRSVLHCFDPNDATDVRGISPLAPAFRKHLQHEKLDDVTLQTAILQTVFAAVLTSEKPSMEAFEALEMLKDNQVAGADAFANEFAAYMSSALDRAANSSIDLSGDPLVSHLAPGESLDIKSAGTPGSQYLPFSTALSRDMARAIGITFGGLTMDYTAATYSSVRMENSSIWPIVTRRRERVAAPVNQAVYEPWLDEMIGTGRIPFKGGYRAFAANRARVCWAQWQGPPKPTADDYKSARASTERLQNGTSSIAIEAADNGVDTDELFDQRLAEHRRYVAAGMRSPYEAASAVTTVPAADPETGEGAA